MEAEFWIARWREGRIGFHEGVPNSYLVKHAGHLTGRVLVPLCGKSVDLAFLASRGHQVVGVELVADAVRQFFAEQGASATVDSRGVYRAGTIEIIARDLFELTPELVGRVDSIYDRAALVALPEDVRPRYVAQLRALAPAASRILLVALDYPPGAADGPPFSVPDAEVRALFPGADIALVDEGPDPRGRAGGRMHERCYAITLRAA
jgi:thiopurine S-methyltransferase